MPERRRRIIFYLLPALGIILLFAVFYGGDFGSSAIKSVCFSDVCFDVVIAGGAVERERGLSGVEKLEINDGMLFIFKSEGKHSFWMKDMGFPLDIIWLDSGMRVAYIARNMAPCAGEICPAIAPDKDARYVLEINAGLADEYGIAEGDYAEFTM